MVKLNQMYGKENSRVRNQRRVSENVIRYKRYGFIYRTILAILSFLCLNLMTLVIPILFPLWFFCSIVGVFQAYKLKGEFKCAYCRKVVTVTQERTCTCKNCKSVYERLSNRDNTITPI